MLRELPLSTFWILLKSFPIIWCYFIKKQFKVLLNELFITRLSQLRKLVFLFFGLFTSQNSLPGNNRNSRERDLNIREHGLFASVKNRSFKNPSLVSTALQMQRKQLKVISKIILVISLSLLYEFNKTVSQNFVFLISLN